MVLKIVNMICHSGNSKKYSVKSTSELKRSTIAGNSYYFLGSSVTQGSASFNESFVDYIAKRNKCYTFKEAVSGTTLADVKDDSYVRRLKKLDVNKQINGFVCQLSTNDSHFDNKGAILSTTDKDEFDVSTTYGAIEYIIAYVIETWNCPIFFYTNSYYENSEYAKMVTNLKLIGEKWNIIIIDLYNNECFNNISVQERKLYLDDDVHPTRAGYKNWWTPEFEKYLCQYIKGDNDKKL